MKKQPVYPLEDIRSFFTRRTFLVTDEYRPGNIVTGEEYRGLKDRTVTLESARAAYLRAFIDGWLAHP